MSKYYNKRITVREHTRFDPRIKKRVSVGQYPRNQRYRNYETVSLSMARRSFNQRSERAKAMDLSKTSKKVFDDPNESWLENIGKSDVKGIDTKIQSKKKGKEKIAFGYGYDPNKLKSGIKNYEYSHTLEDGTKLYEFEPKLPYRLFNIFAKEMGYQTKGNMLKKGDIEIKNDHFITKGDPEQIIKQLNYAISKIFQKYEPLPKYDIGVKTEIKKVKKETLTKSISPKSKQEEDLASNIISLNGVIKYNERELKDPHPSYYRSDIYKYDFDPIKRKEGIDKQKQKLNEFLNEYKKLFGKEKLDKLKNEISTHRIGKKPKKSRSILPKLTRNKKYILAYVSKEGYVSYISYTKNSEKAINDLNAERKISKKLGIKKKIELFVANDIHDVRDQVHARSRKDYLITGDTYLNKTKIHQIAYVKFDYNEKGYRGKLSPEELEKIKKIPGLKVKKFQEITKADIEISNIEKAHSKTKKWMKHEKQKGSTWQKDNPFTKEQEGTWNSLTHYPQDWNKEFKNSVDIKERQILKKLNLSKIEDAPDDVQNAFDYYRKNVYNFIKEHNRAKQVAPPMYVVGPAKYPTHKIPKADAIQKKASEKLEKSKKTVDKITYQYVNLQPKKSAEERRQEYREKITPKLVKAKEKGKKVYSQLYGKWYPIERVNKKTITVKSHTGDYNFTIDKHFIDQIEN